MATRLRPLTVGVLYVARWDRTCSACGGFILKDDIFVATGDLTGRHYRPGCDSLWTEGEPPNAEPEPSRRAPAANLRLFD